MSVKVKGIKSIQAKIKTSIRKKLRSKETREKVGKKVVEYIRENKLGSASPATVKIRKVLEKYNTTHPDYRRRNINITFTGELLEDLIGNVKFQSNPTSYVIEHSNKKHSGYQWKTKKSKRAKYKDISKWLSNMGYDYLDLPDEAQDEILKIIQIVINEAIREVNKS